MITNNNILKIVLFMSFAAFTLPAMGQEISEKIKDFRTEAPMFGYNNQYFSVNDNGDMYTFTNYRGSLEVDGFSIDAPGSGMAPTLTKVDAGLNLKELRHIGDPEKFDAILFGGKVYDDNEEFPVELLFKFSAPIEELENSGFSTEREEGLILAALDENHKVSSVEKIGYVEDEEAMFGNLNLHFARDDDGNYIVYGQYKDDVIMGNEELHGRDSVDWSQFIASFSSDFDLNWVRSFGSEWDSSRGLEIDSEGNIFLGFNFQGAFTWEEDTIMGSELGVDIGAVKLNSDGELEWHWSLPGLGSDFLTEISLLDDRLYLASMFQSHHEINNDSVFFGGDDSDALLLSLDAQTSDIHWYNHFMSDGRASLNNIEEGHDDLLIGGSFTNNIIVDEEQFHYQGTMDDNIPNQNNGILMTMNKDGQIQEKEHVQSEFSVVYSLIYREDVLYVSGRYRKNMKFGEAKRDNGTDSSRHKFFMTRPFKGDLNFIEENHFTPKVKAYPNPFMDEFTLTLSGTDKEEGQIEIFDMKGNMIKTRPFNQETIQVDMDSQPSGIYLWQYRSKNGSSIKSGKVVKE